MGHTHSVFLLMSVNRLCIDKAIDFLEMTDDVNGDAQIVGAIADLRKVKKKKSSVKKLINKLEGIP